MLRCATRSLSGRSPRVPVPIGKWTPPAITRRVMSSHLPAVEPPVSSVLPSDAYQLLSTSEKQGAAEDALYEQQLHDVQTWWDTPRYTGIKRPYSAHDVASKRGALQQTYPSSLMARKLFNLLNERAASGQPVHTSALIQNRDEEHSNRD